MMFRNENEHNFKAILATSILKIEFRSVCGHSSIGGIPIEIETKIICVSISIGNPPNLVFI